jgi:O-antigen/teichoic acid export membrane protein
VKRQAGRTPPGTELARRSVRALAWNSGGALLRAALQLAVQVWLARLLGPAEWGLAAAALIVVGVAALVAELGLPAALVQSDAPAGAPADVAAATLGVVLGCLAVGSTLWLAAPLLASALQQAPLLTLMPWMVLALALQVLAQVPLAVLQRRLASARIQALQLLAYAVAYGGLGTALAWHGEGALSLVLAFALHAALVGIGAAWWAHETSGAGTRLSLQQRLVPARTELRRLLRFGRSIVLANLSNWGIEMADRVMVSRGFGAAPLGEYSVAANLARAPAMMLVGAAQPVMFAASAQLRSEPLRLVRGYLALLRAAWLVAVPASLAAALCAEPLVLALYGPAWQGAVAPFAVACLALPFFVLLALAGPVLCGLGAMALEARWQWALLLLLVGALAALNALAHVGLVWVAAVVAAFTVLRAGLFHGVLTRRLPLAHRDVAAAAAASGVLAAPLLASGAWQLAGGAALPVWADLGLALLWAALGLRWAGPWFIGPHLQGALQQRASDTPGVALLLRCLRLSPGTPA